MDNYDDEHNNPGEEDHFLNGNDRHIGVLELEGEEEEEIILPSRIRRSNGHGNNSMLSRSALRFRHTENRIKQESSRAVNSVMGLLRSGVHGRYTSCSMAFVGFLAVLVLLPLTLEDKKLIQDPSKTKPHGVGLGGGLNTGHDNAGDAHDYDFVSNPNAYAHFETEDEEPPRANTGMAVTSLSQLNRLNYQGHFWHDPYVSPYSSRFYAVNEENVSLKYQQQQKFDQQRTEYIKRYGAFEPPVSDGVFRYLYDHIPYRDVTEFEPDAWQLDKDYVSRFLDQALALVQRVQEGIYDEYGLELPPQIEDREPVLKRREKYFRVIQQNYRVKKGVAWEQDGSDKLYGIAYLPPIAWEGLVRKVWHTMLTHNQFYAVVIGSAATYRGNNLFESQIMQFNEIMEPVFDKLGVKLISRNMGMDASTTVSALGGASIHGEADILWHIAPDMEESDGQVSLLHNQAILSGERMPVVLSPYQPDMESELRNMVWFGNIQSGAEVCEYTTVRSDQSPGTPDMEACKFLRCIEEARRKGFCSRYHSQCWVRRATNSWNPGPGQQQQNETDGFQTEGYDGYQQHRWEGRKLSMLVLNALEEAIKRWQKHTENYQLPPPTEEWHVGPEYENIREKLRTSQGAASPCENLLGKIDKSICHLSMKAYTEWTPRVNPTFHRLSKLVHTPIADESESLEPLYHNVDLRPPEWKLPQAAVNVHMIALATNSTVNEDAVADDFYPKQKDHIKTSQQSDYDFESSDDEFRENTTDGGTVRRELAPVAKTAWTVNNAPIGFCDGSAQSFCHRAINNLCLLANNNHYQAAIVGHGNSGWLNMTLPFVREGLVLLRFDWEMNKKITLDTLPEDFNFVFELLADANDEEPLASGSWSRKDFTNAAVEVVPDVVVHPLFKSETMLRSNNTDARKVDLHIKMESASKPKEAKIFLTHVYYA